MKDNVLCVTDFSESSLHALSWANKFAGCTDAHLAVLFSYRLIQAGNVADIRSFKRKTEEDAKERFLAIQGFLDNGTKVSRSFITEIGFYSDNIESFIKKKPATIVVLSADLANEIHDHKGQTLIDFLKQLKVPLLIVPGTANPTLVSQTPAQSEVVAGSITI